MNRWALVACQAYRQLGRGLLLVATVAGLVSVTRGPVQAKALPEPVSHQAPATTLDILPFIDADPFDAIWTTDLGIHLGIAVYDVQAKPLGVVFWWDEKTRRSGEFGMGIVEGGILEGQLTKEVGGGMFRLTMTPDRKGLEVYATKLWGTSEMTFNAFYSRDWAN